MINSLYANPLIRIPAFVIVTIAGYLFLNEFIYKSFEDAFLFYNSFYSFIILISILFTKDISPIKFKFNLKYFVLFAFWAVAAMILMLLINIILGGEISYLSYYVNIFTLYFYILLGQSIIEEIIFRGVILNLINSKTKSLYALILSSIAFSAIHFDNNSIDILSFINIFLAGYFIGMIYLKTQSILNAISFHLFWNFFQNYILGVSVSGYVSSESIFTTTILENSVSSFIVGNSFGFEAGLSCTIILLISIIIMYKFESHKVNNI